MQQVRGQAQAGVIHNGMTPQAAEKAFKRIETIPDNDTIVQS